MNRKYFFAAILIFIFSIPHLCKAQCCTYTISMHDSYGDGWNGVPGTVKGLLYGGGTSQLTAEVIGVIANFIYLGIATLIVFKLIDIVVGNRVSAAAEVEGLDIPEMGSIGYINADDESADGPLHAKA